MIKDGKIYTWVHIKEKFEFAAIIAAQEDHTITLVSTDSLFKMKIFAYENKLFAIIDYNGNDSRKYFGKHRFAINFEAEYPNDKNKINIEVDSIYNDKYRDICKDRVDNIDDSLYFEFAHIIENSFYESQTDKLYDNLIKSPLDSNDEYWFRSININLTITGWLIQDLSEVDDNRVLIEKAYNKIQDIESKLSGYHDIEDVSHLMSQFMKQYDIYIKNYN
jgi:hypothetical protein